MHRRKLLIVDDDELILRSLQVVLEDEDYDIITVTNCAEAIRHVREDHIDVLLTDLTVIEHCDFDLLRVCETLETNPELIVISGYPIREVRSRVSDFKVKHLLTKPVPDGRLRELVRSCLPSPSASE